MKTHIPVLDGWRGMAISLLLLGHFFPVSGINFGAVGVSLFFVLSGVLMCRILFIDKVSLPVFYRRRIARIFPSVIVFICVICGVFLATGRPISRFELLSAATFTNNYFVTSGPWTMPLGHIWSLSVEEHAYILLSLMALACRAGYADSRRALGATAGAMALCALAYKLLLGPDELRRVFLHSEVSAFGIVASGFLLLHFRRRPTTLFRPAMVPILLVLGIGAFWWHVPAPFNGLVGCSAFALALNLISQAPASLRALLECWPLRQLGIHSFSIYLWQQPFYQLVHHAGMPAANGLALSLLVGVAAYYLIEKPARSWINRGVAAKVVIADSTHISSNSPY